MPGSIKESRAKGHTCTPCQKPAGACTHYLFHGRMTSAAWIWKPISELANEKADDVALCCSCKCEEKWQEVLICPDCNTYEYTKTTTGPQSYPNPRDLLDMTRRYQLRLLQQSQIPGLWVKKEEAGDKPSVKLWTREPRRLKVPICVTCSETMLPRCPLAPHLTNQSLRPNLC